MIAFSVAPAGGSDRSDSVSNAVADSVRVVRESGLPNHTDAMFTTLEGEWDQCMNASCLMRSGAGPGRTREDHLDLAAQLLAALDRARRARQLAEIVSAAALNPTDRLYLSFADTFEQRLINQQRAERRSLDDTLDRCWDVANVLPARELTMLPQRFLDAHPAPAPTSP